MGFITWHGGRERQKARFPRHLAALYPRVAGRQDSWSEQSFIQKGEDALTGVAQWVGHRPEKPKVVASVPVKAHAWVAGQVSGFPLSLETDK